MGQISDAFRRAWRYFSDPANPNSTPHKPDKAEIQPIGELIERAIEGAAAGLVQAETWAQLQQIDGTRIGQPGRVLGPDSGSHSNAGGGGTVPNVGEYMWVGAWRWIGPIREYGEFLTSATESNNWDTLATSGIYRTPHGGVAVGAPTTNINMTVEHVESVGGRAWQRARQADPETVRTWQRFRGSDGIWGEWVESKTAANTGQFDPRATQALNWDVITESGFYRGSSLIGETVGAPATNAYLNLLHIQGQGTASFQLASTSGSENPRQWIRSRTVLSGGEWSEWVEMKTSNNTGEFNSRATQALDWNVITESGFYRGSSNVGQTVGAPVTNAYMSLLHIQGQGTGVFQLASTVGSVNPRQWVRARSVVSGEWSEWSELVKGDQPPTPQGLMPGGLYRENSTIKVIRPESQFYGQTAASIYNNSASELHGHYDQMITDFPDYVSKELLGQDNFGNDIFEYTFAAPPLRGANQTAINKAHPKIVVVNAVHPDEKYSIVGNLCFFDDLCRNWQQDERLADLRWGAKIVLLAVANPSGVNADTRLNAAGVNIGRNLSYDWDNNTSPDKGPAPLSEPESQYIADLAVRHPEACAFIDHHGHAGQHLTWIGARLDKAFTIAKHTARINGAWCRRFVPGLYDDNSITAVTSTTIGGPPCEWAEVYGKNAFLLESAETTGWSGLSRRDNHRVIVESMLCLIHENWRRESETRGYVDP